VIEGRERTIQYPEFFLRPNAPVLLAYPLKDLEGRPCGEANVSEDKLAGIELNFRRCTYPGRRYGHEQDVFLSSPSQRVCSGPIHMVADFVQTIYDGSTGAAVPPFLAGDLNAYLTYGAANILIGLLHIIVRWRLRQQLRRVLACLRRCNGTISGDPRCARWSPGSRQPPTR
jgi:hypothetical protein